MIAEAIVNFFTGVLGFFIGLLPNADPDIIDAINSLTSQFRDAMSSISWFFPVNTALSLFAIIIAIQAGIFAFKAIRYILGFFTFGISR